MSKSNGSIDVTAGAPRVRALDVGRFRVSHATFSPGWRIPSHYHDRAVLSVVVEGRFQQRFPGRDYDCPPGGVLIKPPGERHVDRWYDARARHLIVEPDPARHDELGECAALVEEIGWTIDPGATGMARRIIREIESAEPGARLAVEALTLELMVRRLRSPAAAEAKSGRPPPSWLERVRELLHDRFREDLRLDDLSREAGVHPTHLSRTFGEYYSRGLVDYLRELRLQEARRELVETDDPISRIAVRNRFSDQSHLTRVLREATGLTPTRYRRTRRR